MVLFADPCVNCCRTFACCWCCVADTGPADGVLPELLANANFNGGTYTWSAASGSGVMAHGWGDNTEWVTPPVSIQTSMVSGAEARSGSALKLQILSGFSQVHAAVACLQYWPCPNACRSC